MRSRGEHGEISLLKIFSDLLVSSFFTKYIVHQNVPHFNFELKDVDPDISALSKNKNLTIAFRRSWGRSVDTMQRPRGKIGGHRARWHAHTMAHTVSIVLLLTCPRALHESSPNDEGTPNHL